MEALLGQLFLDVDAKHVDADSGEGAAPPVRDEQLVGPVVGAPRRALRRFRRTGRPRPGRSRLVDVPFGRHVHLVYLLVEPHQLVAHVRQEQLVDLVQLRSNDVHVSAANHP